MLREFAVDVHPTRVRFAENVLRQMELVAVGTARATPGAAQLVLGALGAGRQVAVVSNNSDASVEKYLDQENLRSNFTFVSARYSAMDPALLKPDPHLLHRALDWLNTAPSDAVIVGDSIADIEAGRVAGVMTIGFSTRQAKRDDLLEAGADAVCDDLFRIVDALAPKPEDRT
ncbi:phosphoglycolate phosphatase [Asanoa ishikariensis]|uniref:Phosphoglycolate phosphatase n=1 Tax=Asanoa ishikariensis TaxID=137265 RepID=A0A1H3N9J6_9ACTN|nr:phosphoglycolate phosphatase [Asanoa ishikariensis]